MWSHLPVSRTLLVGGALMLSACVPAQLQVRTSPSGAVISEIGSGKQFRTPVDIPYALTDKHRDASGCYLVNGFMATWASGAQNRTSDHIQLCGPGPIWNYTINRPTGHPNLATDIQVDRQIAASQQRNAELMRAAVGGFVSGLNSRSGVHVPPPISTQPLPGIVTTPGGSGLTQITPGGGYVSADRPVSICPDGSYVAGNCVITPNGKFVGQ